MSLERVVMPATQSRSRNFKRFASETVVFAVLVGLGVLGGCADFFPPLTSGNGNGNGSSGDFVYTINTLTNTISGFAVGSGTLTKTPGTPFALNYTPQSAVLQIGNSHFFVGAQAAIYSYIVGSDGSLGGGTAQVVFDETSMDVSPDGNWLVGLNGVAGAPSLDVFAINKTTSALTHQVSVSYTITDATAAPKMVKISSDGKHIYAALGVNGNAVFSFDTSTGTPRLVQQLTFTKAAADNGVAVDSAVKYAYFARTGNGAGLAAYAINSADGTLTALSTGTVAAGAQPLSVVLNSTGTNAYVANGTDATISGYSLANGVATPLSVPTYSSGATVGSLTLDNSGKYLLAAAFAGSPDLTLYSFSSTATGQLVQATSAATGTDPAGALLVVATH